MSDIRSCHHLFVKEFNIRHPFILHLKLKCAIFSELNPGTSRKSKLPQAKCNIYDWGTWSNQIQPQHSHTIHLPANCSPQNNVTQANKVG